MVELTSLWLPTLLSAVALFFIGYLTWMVIPTHNKDWIALPDEDGVGKALRDLNVPAGNYMFPYCADPKEMQSEAFIEKQKQGPNGTLQVWDGPCSMGANLGCQFGFLLVTSFCLAYLATLGPKAGDDFMTVFRFVGTAGILTYAAGTVPSSIWFKTRLTGNVIDGVLYGLATGAIFAALWPGGPTG